MRTLSNAAILAAAFMLSASAAIAGPCDTTGKAKSPNDQAANQQSSDTDKSTKNLADGQQPSSAKTVGAMNNVSPTGTAGTSQQASGTKGDKEDPGSKNLAGGNQPASPGTVGAMNNAPGAGQGTGQQAPKDDC